MGVVSGADIQAVASARRVCARRISERVCLWGYWKE